MSSTFENIILTDGIRNSSLYLSDFKGSTATVPSGLFVREILEGRLTPETLSIPDLQKCIIDPGRCIYFGCNGTQFVRELVRKVMLTHELFDVWFTHYITHPAVSLEMNLGEDLETSVWSVSPNIAEPLRSELVKLIGSKLSREKLIQLGCKFLSIPDDELPLNTVNTTSNFLPRITSIFSEQPKSQLLNVCILLIKNQDILAKQVARKILNRMKDDVKIFEAISSSEVVSKKEASLDRVRSIPIEMNFDTETFSNVEFDDTDVPLVRTPDVINRVSSVIRPQDRHPSIVEQIQNMYIQSKRESTIIPDKTIIGALLNLPESTVVNIVAWFQKMAPMVSLIHVVCIIFVFLLVTKTISSRYSYITLIGCPALILRFLLLNIYLTKQLFRYFETWFLLAQIFVGCIVGIDMFRDDVRGVIIIYLTVVQVVTVFYDATSSRARAKFYLLILAILFWLILIITIYGGIWEYESRTLNLGGNIKVTTGDVFVQRYLTLMFFTIRHMVNALLYPDCFVTLTSRLSMSSVKIQHQDL